MGYFRNKENTFELQKIFIFLLFEVKTKDAY